MSLLTARSPEELLDKLGGHPIHLELARGDDEWQQLWVFLKCCAFSRLLRYSLSIDERTNKCEAPDYRIRLAEQVIGIEVSSIDNDQLHQGRLDHARESAEGNQRGARCFTALMVDPRKRTRAERTAETRITQVNELPPTCSEFSESWLRTSWNLINRKTKNLARKDYRRGNRDWLLLTDWFYSSNHGVTEQLTRLIDIMEDYWIRKPRFERVIVQTQDFAHLMITEDGIARLS